MLGLLATSAQAQSQAYLQTYNQAVDNWKAAARTGKYDAAKKLFLKAIKMDPGPPGPYRYLALIAQSTDKWQDCVNYAVAAAKRNLKSRYIDELQKMHAACRKKLNRAEFNGTFESGGAIYVTSTPQGATVKLNGLTFGATPLGPRNFAKGKATIGLTLAGHLPANTTAEVVPGFVTDVHIDLKRDPNAKTTTDPKQPTNGDDVKTGWITLKVDPPTAKVTIDGKAPEIGKDGRIETTPDTHTVIAEAEGYERWGRRVRVAKGQIRALSITLRKTSERQADRKKGYLYLGAAAVAGALGVAFGILEGNAFEEARDIYDIESTRPTIVPVSVSGMLQPLRTRQDLEDAKSRGNTYRLLQATSLGVAAVALGVSIYYFAKERPSERKGSVLPVVITPLLPSSADVAGVGAQVTYTTRLNW